MDSPENRAPEKSVLIPYWKRCEHSWASWLRSQQWSVTPMTDAVGNTDGTSAPMIQLPGHKGRHPVPDFHCIRHGKARFYEVKSRLGPEVDSLTGIKRHWMLRKSFESYLKIARSNDTPVWVAVHERTTATTPARWLEISLAKIDEVRLEGVMTFEEGEDEVVFWPAELMRLVDAPAVSTEDDATWAVPIRAEEFPPASPEESDLPQEKSARFGAEFMGLDADEKQLRAGLENLRRAIGVPMTPQYSVLRVGYAHGRLLELTEYGIRVFLITSEAPKDANETEAARRRALVASRLLEIVILPDLAEEREHWQVDGRDIGDAPEWLDKVLEAADNTGGINLRQYRIVHEPAEADVSVMAGAGTGKTETMSERLLFLLSTSRVGAPAELRLTDVAITTFSREAAAQIARRVAFALSMRRRLCPRNVHPVLAWLTQVGSARISTIHQFARHIIAVSGARVGLSPEFSISSGTMHLRELVTDALAVPLAELYRAHGKHPPPVHEWRRHIEAVWDALQNNGVRLMEDPSLPCVRWGPPSPNLGAADAAIVALVQATIHRLREGFKIRCIENQFLPTGQLIPWARSILDSVTEGAEQPDGTSTVRAHPDLRFRHLFVDEFQDTDQEQLQLVLAVRKHIGARLFVVGDVKQGIYRFRGAAGNAFSSLDQQAVRWDLKVPKSFTLTRNFRTGQALLDSLHPHFTSWRAHRLRLLDYEATDRLTSNPIREKDESTVVSVRTIPFGGLEDETARVIGGWRTADASGRFAVLCRRNSDAKKIYAKLVSLGVPCEIRTGRDFYQSEPVHETRAFLQAVLDPDDPAALLELLETRWGIALMLRRTAIGHASAFDWEADVLPVVGWDQRLASLARAGNPSMTDLESVRTRAAYLSSVARRMSPLAFLILCRDLLRPENHGEGVDTPGVSDRYGRSIDHLVTIMDEQFADAPVTLGGLVDWLRNRIAIDDTEDGPPLDDDGKGIVRIITVHRAKGLEFDRVIIANTSAAFGAHRHVTTTAAVLADANGRHRALWRWKERGRETWQWVNPPEDAKAWAEDETETTREETRLLYVAMTRAKHELVILSNRRLPRVSENPTRWCDLLVSGV